MKYAATTHSKPVYASLHVGGYGFAKSFAFSIFKQNTSRPLCRFWSLLRKALILIAKTSTTAETLCAIRLDINLETI
jgi:hypothetical protein